MSRQHHNINNITVKSFWLLVAYTTHHFITIMSPFLCFAQISFKTSKRSNPIIVIIIQACVIRALNWITSFRFDLCQFSWISLSYVIKISSPAQHHKRQHCCTSLHRSSMFGATYIDHLHSSTATLFMIPISMLIKSSITYHTITGNLITAQNAWDGIRHVVSFRSVLYHLSWKQMCDRSSDRDVDHSRNFVGFSHYVITDANRIVDHIRFWKIRGRYHEITICVWKKQTYPGRCRLHYYWRMSLNPSCTQSFLIRCPARLSVSLVVTI